MESELKHKIEHIESHVNLKKILAGEKNSPGRIRWYYRINGAAYRRFHSDRGFMHFRISKSGSIEENDVYYQPDVIGGYIGAGASVLELGPGQGANIFYLACKFPEASFIGVDLKPPKVKKDTPSNVKFCTHDYGDLSMLRDCSVDVAYGIETIVHCSDKERVFREVRRVLKPQGVFIVYDYATRKEFADYLPYEQTAIELTSKCGASALIESDEAWRAHLSNAGFTEVSITDYGKEVLPDLKRLMHTAGRVMDNDRRRKLLFALFPSIFSGNILIGYIGYDIYNEGICCYNEWICKKE